MTFKRLCRLLVVWFAVSFAAVSPAATPASADADPNFPKPAVDADRYILGPGDVIQVFVWQNPDLSASGPVLSDGTFTSPLVDGISASGKTPVQLGHDIEKALAEYVKSPRVSVSVASQKSALRQVKLVGEFAKPQSISFQEGMTVMDAALEVGGLTPYASGNKAKIMRKVGGKDQEIPVKLKSLLEKGDLKQNLPLQPGDILIVPKTLL